MPRVHATTLLRSMQLRWQLVVSKDKSPLKACMTKATQLCTTKGIKCVQLKLAKVTNAHKTNVI